MYNQPGRNDRYAADRTAEDLEGQNDDALQGLSQKVKLLKNVRFPLSPPTKVTEAHSLRWQITINIGNEVRDSTKMLNGMVRLFFLVSLSFLSFLATFFRLYLLDTADIAAESPLTMSSTRRTTLSTRRATFSVRQ
jgi:hypothetical protein